MGYFGIFALAAFQIAMQCASVAYAVPFALSMATALQVGHANGAKDILEVQHKTLNSFFRGVILSSLIAMIFIFFPDNLVKLFLHPTENHFQEINQLAQSFFMVVALFQCFDAIQGIANGALRGLKDTLVPMLLSIGCYWIIGVGSSYYLSFYTHFGPIGIWYGLTLGIFSAGFALGVRFLKSTRGNRYDTKKTTG
jgi:MATE family multidrug resistance protein